MKPTTPNDLPMRRVAGLWNWLPAFRAVAETENLRKAARYLALSPPALSRSLRLLEDSLGYPLFHRDGRKLRLTERGQALLVVMRRAMRSVDEVMSRPPGGLRVMTLPQVAPLIAPCVGSLAPGARLTTQPLGMSAAQALLRGSIDLAVLPDAAITTHKDLLVSPVGGVLFAVFRGEAKNEDDAAPPAVAMSGWDAWPAERPRAVALETDDLTAALAAAREGLALALPLSLANPDLVQVGASWRVTLVTARRTRDAELTALDEDYPDLGGVVTDALRARFTRDAESAPESGPGASRLKAKARPAG